jgi:AMMECR1 domain-containing protein
MLPQVATGNHWTLEQFLGYTSRDKAGLGWEGWKNADIYIYEAVVLEENRK